MPRGYDPPLYIQPFDHRGSFQTKMFGWQSPLSDARQQRSPAPSGSSTMAFLQRSRAGYRRRRRASLLTSNLAPPFCATPPSKNITTACPAEKSGQREFDFEYGEDFARHIEAFDPTFCKVLVRYNPQGDGALNRRQAASLKRLSDYLAAAAVAASCSSFWSRRRRCSSTGSRRQRAYDLELRPRLMVEAIQELQDRGRGAGSVEDRRARSARGLRACSRGGARRRASQVGCIVLGRGEDDCKVA